MELRRLLRRACAASLLVALSTATAGAQTITFSTDGSFSGDGCTSTTCTFGGFTLTYTDAASTSYFSGSLVDLGMFVTQATGESLDLASIGSNVMFTLMINQTQPGAGTGSYTGAITGQLAYNPSFSSLYWVPTQQVLQIDGVTYDIVTDDNGRINIAAPTTGTNGNPNSTVVKAMTATVPEPATMFLVGTGLLGVLGGAARQRRRKNHA